MFTAWLKDKRVSSKFALPALYQPYSLIPYDVWKASPSSTNGNEQSHRNIYRDGVNLTVLAGIMRGMQFDARATTSIKLFDEHGIYPRDQQATHFRRYERSVHRHGMFGFLILQCQLLNFPCFSICPMPNRFPKTHFSR